MHIFKRKKEADASKTKIRLPLGKRLLIGLTSAVVAFAAVMLPTDHDVFASSVQVVDYGAYYNGEWESMIIYQGTPAYCIQRDTLMPAPYIKTGTQADVYSTLSFDSFGGLSNDVKRRLAAYTYYGYGYSGRGDYSWYFATQEAVWGLFGVGGNYWSGSVGNADLQNKKNIIINDANNYLNQQGKSYSLHIKDENGNQVGTTNFTEGGIGKTYTITDTSGQLSKSTITRNDFGNRLKISGNTMTVTLNESDYKANRTVSFSNSASNSLPQRGTNLFLYSGSYQNVVTLSTPRAVASSGSFTISATGVPVILGKENENNEQLAGAKMALYKNQQNGQQTLIESYTTTSEPKKFTLQPGNYTLYETEAPTGYYVNDPVTFDVKATTDIVQRFDMVDYPIAVTFDKFGNQTGDTVVGAHIQISSDKTGEVVDDFYTTDDVTVLSGYKYRSGETYTVKELSAPPGYYVLENPATIQIPKQKPADSDLTNGSYLFSIADEEIDYRVLKLDATTNQPVVGATMQLIGNDGKVLEEWVTDGTEHQLDKTKLEAGSSYSVHEKSAPKGYYVMAQDLSFTVYPTIRKTFELSAYDFPIRTTITKVDDNGSPVKGAVLALYDGDTEIDRWETTTEAHSVNGLEADKEYTIKEISAPEGYYRTATPKKFTVSSKSTKAQDTAFNVNFENSKIEYSVQKIDKKSKERISGVEFEVRDEDGNVLTTLTSSSNEAVAIPNDILESGKTYTIHESKTIDGYYYADADAEFTVPETVEEAKKVDKNTFTITIADKPIKYSVLKVDEKTGETVEGAFLALYDNPDSDTPIHTWKSTDEPEVLSDYVGLTAGKEYYIKELDAPNGYYLNNDVAKILIPYNTDRNDTIKVSFYNKPIVWHILKQDMDGNVLSTINKTYFTLEVYDTNETLDNIDDDALIATLKTDDADYKANGYFDMASYIKQGLIKGGHHYRIHEVTAANGYRVADDMIQEISPMGETDTLLTSVTDDEIRVYLKKVDENGNLLTTYKTLTEGDQGFKLSIYEEGNETDPVVTIDTSDEQYAKSGYIDISKYLSATKDYIVKETEYPRGYYKAKDFNFNVNNLTYEEIDGKQVGVITMVDPTLRAQFRKEDEIGNVITKVNGEGFEFIVYDTKGTDDTSDDEPVATINTANGDISNGGWIEFGQYLQEATTYRIHESYAPQGYAYSTKDAYLTTPGYYNEQEGHVQNVVVVN